MHYVQHRLGEALNAVRCASGIRDAPEIKALRTARISEEEKTKQKTASEHPVAEPSASSTPAAEPKRGKETDIGFMDVSSVLNNSSPCAAFLRGVGEEPIFAMLPFPPFSTMMKQNRVPAPEEWGPTVLTCSPHPACPFVIGCGPRDKVVDRCRSTGCTPLQRWWQNQLFAAGCKPPLPNSMHGFKISPYYCVEAGPTEALHPEAKPCGIFKGRHRIYRRSDVYPLRSMDEWHKQGRQLKFGAHSAKQAGGGKTHLYAFWDTEPMVGADSKALEEDTRLPIGAKTVDKSNEDPMIACQNMYGHWDACESDGSEKILPPDGLAWVKHELAREICLKHELPSVFAATGWIRGPQGSHRVHTGVLVYESDAALVSKEAEELGQKRAVARAEREEKREEKAKAKLKRSLIAERLVNERWKD